MIEEIIVNSVSEYVKFIGDSSLEFSLSRGQGKDFPLLPGALRKNKDGNRLYTKMDIKKFLSDFKSESIYYLDNAILNTEETDNVVFAQHYGLPTYLLDFTYSHIISLAFALEDAFKIKIDTDSVEFCVVWFVNPEQINFASIKNAQIINIKSATSDTFDKPIFITCNKIHSRISAQNGVFLFFNENNLALEEYEEYHSFIKKIKIPLSKSKKMLSDLYKLGVRHSMLYPELPTVAKDILLKNQVIEFCKDGEENE
jgi:hypothetical protein